MLQDLLLTEIFLLARRDYVPWGLCASVSEEKTVSPYAANEDANHYEK